MVTSASFKAFLYKAWVCRGPGLAEIMLRPCRRLRLPFCPCLANSFTFGTKTVINSKITPVRFTSGSVGFFPVHTFQAIFARYSKAPLKFLGKGSWEGVPLNSTQWPSAQTCHENRSSKPSGCGSAGSHGTAQGAGDLSPVQQIVLEFLVWWSAINTVPSQQSR